MFSFDCLSFHFVSFNSDSDHLNYAFMLFICGQRPNALLSNPNESLGIIKIHSMRLRCVNGISHREIVFAGGDCANSQNKSETNKQTKCVLEKSSLPKCKFPNEMRKIKYKSK